MVQRHVPGQIGGPGQPPLACHHAAKGAVFPIAQDRRAPIVAVLEMPVERTLCDRKLTRRSLDPQRHGAAPGQKAQADLDPILAPQLPNHPHPAAFPPFWHQPARRAA
jgi:hypothetical protein